MSVEFYAWIQKRIALAKRLNEGECGGYYGDAMLILSAVISGLAADLWPGRGNDRRRFVEIWATHSRPDLTPNLISVPLLLNALEKEGDTDLVEKVRATRPKAFPPWKIDTLRVSGMQVDQTEAELIALDTRLATKRLRHFSYGNVFYKHVRSEYTHEYHTTDSASSVSTASEPAPVSYMNSNSPPVRRIHFDVAWVADIVESISASVMALSGNWPLTDPKTWWVDG